MLWQVERRGMSAFRDQEALKNQFSFETSGDGARSMIMDHLVLSESFASFEEAGYSEAAADLRRQNRSTFKKIARLAAGEKVP